MEKLKKPQFAPKMSEEEKTRRIKDIKIETNENGEKYVCVYLSDGEYFDDYSILEIGNYVEDKYKTLIFNKKIDTIIEDGDKVIAYKFFYK